MKSFLKFIVLGLFALAACLPATEPESEQRSEDSAPADGEAIFSEDAALYPGTNLSLIGGGERPQFLNTFADW